MTLISSSYLDILASRIEEAVPKAILPSGDRQRLFRLYAVLCLTRGMQTTAEDVHHAWSAWMLEEDPSHASLVPPEELDSSTYDMDEPFAAAIRQVACQDDPVAMALMPTGPPSNSDSLGQFYNQYRLMVESSEALVTRRQQVNTFFLTIMGVLLTAAALFLRENGSGVQIQAGGIAVLSLAACVLSWAWRSLIRSFGQLNTGKFAVINRMEAELTASVYAAEWLALGEGKDPKLYRSFTSREIWIPNIMMFISGVALVVAGLVWFVDVVKD